MKKNSFSPFFSFSNQLQELLTKASQQKNPALWLHQNKVRSLLFMLEGLTRLHKNAFNEKLFDKWNKRFKKLEDIFGEIDQNLSLEAELKLNKKNSNEVIKYFNVHALNSLERCNQRLIEKDWFNGKLDSFTLKLDEFDVEYNKEYIDELRKAIKDEIEAILIFCEKVDFQFTKIEEEVHEIRRKLRWLSIYGQALNGLIQLKKSSKKRVFSENYFTKTILNSPYNVLPKKPSKVAILEFDSDSFFALSWLINKLGDLKDIGLNTQLLSNAIFITGKLTQMEASDKALASLGLNKQSQNEILKLASSHVFNALSKDKILNSLII